MINSLIKIKDQVFFIIVFLGLDPDSYHDVKTAPVSRFTKRLEIKIALFIFVTELCCEMSRVADQQIAYYDPYPLLSRFDT